MPFDCRNYSIVCLMSSSVFSPSECARVFHAAGARLILCGRDQKRLQEVVEELRNKNNGKIQVKTFNQICYSPFWLFSQSCVIFYACLKM